MFLWKIIVVSLLHVREDAVGSGWQGDLMSSGRQLESTVLCRGLSKSYSGVCICVCERERDEMK